LQPVPLVPPAPESRPAERPFTVQKRVAVPERERSTPEVLDDLRADRNLEINLDLSALISSEIP